MGLPTSFKRARSSPSPDEPCSPGLQSLEPWSFLADGHAKRARSSLPWCAQGSPQPAQDQQQQDPAPMERLPEALLLRVVQMSQPTAWDLCRLSCVSRSFRSACAHRSFWTRLRVGSGSLRPGVEQLAPRCTQLTELFVDDPRCELHVLHPIIIACAPSLRRVVVDCDRDATPRNEASISSVLWLISLYCKNVESVELQSAGRDVTAGCLEGRTMWYLTSAFRNMRYFASLARGSLTKQCVYLMAIAWRDLECVRLHMEGLALEDLLALRKCGSLKALELVGGRLTPLPGSTVLGPTPARSQSEQCPGVMTAPPVFHPGLELLVLNRVEFDAETVAALALTCPSLKRILVSGSLCASCLVMDGPCQSSWGECVRQRVDLIQQTLSRVRVSLHDLER